jgi:hypothetical protein
MSVAVTCNGISLAELSPKPNHHPQDTTLTLLLPIVPRHEGEIIGISRGNSRETKDPEARPSPNGEARKSCTEVEAGHRGKDEHLVAPSRSRMALEASSPPARPRLCMAFADVPSTCQATTTTIEIGKRTQRQTLPTSPPKCCRPGEMSCPTP